MEETEYYDNLEEFFLHYCQVTVPFSAKNPNGICNHKVENGSTTYPM